MELRKDTARTPTRLICAEGNMNGGTSASPYSVRRSRRPQARLETSCTRTGRPRGCLRRSWSQDGGRRLRPHGPHVRLWGVTLRHSTDESFEQRQVIVGGECGGKAADGGEH